MKRPGVVVIFFLLLLLGVGFYFSKSLKPKLTSTPSPTSLVAGGLDPKTLLEELKAYLNLKPENTRNIEEFQLLWKKNDGQITQVNGFLLVAGAFDFDKEKGVSLETKLESGKTYSTSSQTFFNQKQFQQNSTNTKTDLDPTDTALSETNAFEKGDTKCAITYYLIEVDPFFQVTCGVYDAQFDLFYQEMRVVGNPTDDPNCGYIIGKHEGDFVAGTSGCGGGGAGWIAKKTGGRWEKIWEGQTGIPCSLAEKYQVPSAIAGECNPNQ